MIAADVLGLGALLLVLLDYFEPSLLLLPTIAAGGDTPCHYPTAVYFHEQFLPQLRLHGWYPGAYMGHPLLLYYFPLPFLLMSTLAPLVGMPVAFKLGTVLGVFLLPPLVYAAFRLLDFRFPTPLLGAASSLVFLFLEDNPIWGGTIASTLTGEFSYTYGLGLGVLFLGVVYRAHLRGKSPVVPAALLGLTALAHGYAVLWAGLSASFLLFATRRPSRTLVWLLTVAGLAFAFAAFFLLPLLSDWGWTTAYDDPWITVKTENLVPSLLWPLLGCAAIGLVVHFALARRSGSVDARLLLLAQAAAIGAGLAAAGPLLGIIDVRFVPFAQLSACLLGSAALGYAIQGLAAADLAALGLVGLAVVYADGRSKVVRHWIDWNYTGLQAKEQWPAWQELNERLAGTVADPRVAVEYSSEHEKAGSIRMYETLPLLSGRSTLEGVYNQASLQTHPVYYLASELGAASPNPFRNRSYSKFDTDRALHHLRMFNTREIVALSPKLIASLASRDDVESVAQIPPYHVYRLKDPGPGYVEPLAYRPRAFEPSRLARQGLQVVLPQATQPGTPGLHRGRTLRAPGHGRVAGASRAGPRPGRRSRRDRGSRAREHPHESPRPSSPREDLLPSALASRRCRRSLSRFARTDAGGAAGARGPARVLAELGRPGWMAAERWRAGLRGVVAAQAATRRRCRSRDAIRSGGGRPSRLDPSLGRRDPGGADPRPRALPASCPPTVPARPRPWPGSRTEPPAHTRRSSTPTLRSTWATRWSSTRAPKSEWASSACAVRACFGRDSPVRRRTASRRPSSTPEPACTCHRRSPD